MNAIPPTMTPGSYSIMAFGHEDTSALSLKWTALQGASTTIAALAGIATESTTLVRQFPDLIHEAATWRRDLAERGIEDIIAMMEPGIAALLGVEARGADSGPAALALWQEFVEARSAVLALLPPSGAQGPLLSG